MKITTTLALALLLGSCHFGEPWADPVMPPKARRQTLPQKCEPLYNLPGEAWQDCMGVEYK